MVFGLAEAVGRMRDTNLRWAPVLRRAASVGAARADLAVSPQLAIFASGFPDGSMGRS